MDSSHPAGPALVAAAADADPVTLLVLGWLAANRSENTRTAYARDIGITPPRRPSRAPSWLTWCQEQGVHPVTGVTMLHVTRYARQLDDRRAVPGQRGPQARRRVQLVRLAGPARAYPRQPGRRHRPAPGRPGRPARAGPNPGPGPQAPPRGRSGTRPPARPHRRAGGPAAVHRRPPQRDHRRRHQRPRHPSGTPGAVGHPRQRPPPGPAAARPGRRPDRRLPRRAARPARRPRAVRHRDRQTAVPRRRAAHRAPPRHPGRPARRPGQPPRTPHATAHIRHAVPAGRRIAQRPAGAMGHTDPRTTRRYDQARYTPATDPARPHRAAPAASAPVCTPSPGPRHRGPGADPTAAPGSLSVPPGIPAALITRPTAKRRDLARWAYNP